MILFQFRRRQLVACLVLSSLIGCEGKSNTPPQGNRSSSTTTDSDADAVKLLPMEIQLNWMPEAEHGGYFAAVVHGYYAEEGLEVKLLPGGRSISAAVNVDKQAQAFGVENADKMSLARAEGAEVVAVFAPIQDSPRCIMVHAESGITTLEELAKTGGMTLAWSNSQPFAKFLKQKLDLSGLKEMNYSGVGPFLLDKKQAMQAYNISEPFLARKERANPVNLMLSDAGFNTYTSMLLTNRKMLTEQPDVIRKMVRASQRGWQKYLTDPEESNRRIAELNPEMPVDVLAYGVQELQSLCRPNDLPESEIGRMELPRWETLVRQLEEMEVIQPGAVKAAAAFTTEFLPAGK